MNAKNIKFFKNSLNNKNSISFSHIKFLLILFFAQKMMEFWLFFLSCFWGPQNLLGLSKKTQLLDLWICLKKLGLEPDIYGKSVLYLVLLLYNGVTTFLNLHCNSHAQSIDIFTRSLFTFNLSEPHKYYVIFCDIWYEHHKMVRWLWILNQI